MNKLKHVLLLPLALIAQDTPTFKANTNLVIINLTVHDKSGKLVDNLKKEDFVLYEDNKPQAISVFEIERLKSEPLTPAPDTQQLKTRAPEPPTPKGPVQDAILGQR